MKRLGQEPAFPKDSFTNQYQIGMSRRFYAACAAMQGLLSNSELITSLASKVDNEYEFHKQIIISSYKLSDELLKQEDHE